MPTIGFIGFGEAGSAIARGLIESGLGPITAYDIAYETSDLVQSRAAGLDVALLPDPAHLAGAADVIFSAVVCNEALVAARSLESFLRPGHWLLDINSVSPGVKAEAADLAGRRGANYVDVAVMSNVSSDLARLPLLGAGARADFVPELFPDLNLNYQVVSSQPGDAARIKMYRSLFVKGLEALALEAMMGSYASGLHNRVLESLDVTFAKDTFSELVQRLIGRHAVHGKRRAAELEEVARTLAEIGVEPLMARAGHSRLSWDVERGLQDRFDQDSDPDWLVVLAELESLRQSGTSNDE